MKITLSQGDFGTYLVTAPDGRDVLFQNNWYFPSLASTFGWRGKVAKKYGTGPSAEIAAAIDYLDSHDGKSVQTPGYFDQEEASEPGAHKTSFSREHSEMRALLSKHGFDPRHAANLLKEGIGPVELEHRIKTGDLTKSHRISRTEQIAPHMWVISRDSSGALIVTIGDPRKGGSSLKRRFSGKDKHEEMRRWVDENVGTTVRLSHMIDLTGKYLGTGASEPGSGPRAGSLPRASAGECVVVQLDSGHDKNGNPKRAFLIVGPNGIVNSVDEGHAGLNALYDLGKTVGKQLVSQQPMLVSLVVPRSTYKSAMRLSMHPLLPGKGQGPECLALHLDSGRDPNGNPKRLFLVLDQHGVVAAVDEGSLGVRAIDAELGPKVGLRLRRMLAAMGAIAVERSTYSALVRQFGRGGAKRSAVRAVCHEPGGASVSRATVRKWMRRHVGDWDTSTELAEQAAQEFGLYKGAQADIPEWVFEVSAELQPTL